jgi:serine/threonine-protein kinase
MGYEILSIHEAGTYGTVLMVTDPHGKAQCIGLKVLNQLFVDDQRVLRRARDEARILSKLRHPNILEVYGLSDHCGWPVLQMEWVHGLSLRNLLDKAPGGLPLEISTEIIRRVSVALDFAFEAPVGVPPKPLRLVHRDLKPGNIMVNQQGIPKIIDFGMAYGEFQNRESITVSMVLGTRRYLSPERLDGVDDFTKGDVYANGVMLFELLTGRVVTLSMNPKHHQTRLAKALTEVGAMVSNPSERKRLTSLLESMVAYSEEDRPGHRTVAKELEAVMAIGEHQPNLNAYAQVHIAPYIAVPEPKRVHEHARYHELSFLTADSETMPTK